MTQRKCRSASSNTTAVAAPRADVLTTSLRGTSWHVPGPSRPTASPRWRGGGRCPPEAFHDADHLLLETTLEQIDVLPGSDDIAAALEGDAAAAIGFAFSLMPIEKMTLRADIAMTTLLRCALERNAAAALVLAQVLGLTNLGHSHATELATSWLAYGRRHSTDPRRFGEAEVVLCEAFREHQGNDGDGSRCDGSGLPLEEPIA